MFANSCKRAQNSNAKTQCMFNIDSPQNSKVYLMTKVAQRSELYSKINYALRTHTDTHTHIYIIYIEQNTQHLRTSSTNNKHYAIINSCNRNSIVSSSILYMS